MVWTHLVFQQVSLQLVHIYGRTPPPLPWVVLYGGGLLLPLDGEVLYGGGILLPLDSELLYGGGLFLSLIGNYDENKHAGLLFPKGMRGLNSTPYTEFSAGIENIFKIIKVEAVWRYNYNDAKKPQIGIMFSLQLTL